MADPAVALTGKSKEAFEKHVLFQLDCLNINSGNMELQELLAWNAERFIDLVAVKKYAGNKAERQHLLFVAIRSMWLRVERLQTICGADLLLFNVFFPGALKIIYTKLPSGCVL